MERVRFSNCLNKEVKLYNLPVGGIAGAILFGGIMALFKGVLWVAVVGAVGYGVGSWLTKQWWLGKLQRRWYWQLPLAQIVANKKIPPSHIRHFN
jgi:hypothetical protein